MFALDFVYYHEGECTEKKKLNKGGSFDKKDMCILCAREEGLLVWARNR